MAELCYGAGIGGDTMLATPLGFVPAQDLRPGDDVRSLSGAPTIVTGITPAQNDAWLRIPALALGNRRAFVVGQGQGVLITSRFAKTISGAHQVVVPALALCGWHGISPCPAPKRAVRVITQRPAVLLAASGAMIATRSEGKSGFSTDDLPPAQTLSLASAQQLVACFIAYEAGVALRGYRPFAAVI
jgi:hypothetical protein